MKTTKIGVIGAGFISNYHIPALQASGADVTWISSLVESEAKQQAEKYGIPHTTTRFEDILSNKDVQTVVILTPDFTHRDVAVAAAQAGKGMLLQKPMARNSGECREIIRAAEANRVPLFVSFMHRYFVEVEKTRQLLAENALGQIFSFRQRNATPGADWAPWFFSKEKVGGGVVLQLGVHGIDLLRHLFGEITAVRATTSLVKKERRMKDGTIVHPDNEDLAIATYRFASGLIGVHEVLMSEAAGTDRFRLEIYGEEGTAWLRTERGALAVFAPGYFKQEGWITPTLPEGEMGERQHRHFLEMLNGEAPMECTGYDGLASLEISEAIYRSSDSGAWEEVQSHG